MMETTLGQDREVAVEITVKGPQVSVPVLSSESRAAPVSSLRVLVVDDNLDAARALAILVKVYGHEVQEVYDGVAALKAVHQFRPQLVLLDVGLPGMNGFEVARQIRTDLDLNDMILVAITGFGQESDKQQSREAGFDFHLVKPADFHDINQILEAACKSHNRTICNAGIVTKH